MLRKSILTVLLLAALSLSAANPMPMNLQFETGTPGTLPPGWTGSAAESGYTIELSSESPKQGTQSARVSGAPKAAAEGGRPSFGSVMQAIDATPFRGKRVRMRAAVRVEGAAATAGLWMRVDRPQRQVGFFDNMQNRPIRSAEWAYYEITGEVANDAETLNIGMLLLQEGKAWLDDVTLEATPLAPPRAAPPRALTQRGLENLIAFTRLLGVVRYFHPSDEAASADWEAVAVNGIDVVEGAKDADELAARLADVFLPLAPSLRVGLTETLATAGLVEPKDAQTLVAWEHRGLGQKQQQQNSIYASERVRRDTGEADARFPDPLQPLQLDLGGGVSASLPLTVYANGTHTLPRATRESIPFAKESYTGNDRATRLGAVVMLWSSLQHFYPYFDVVDADWPAELKTALRAAATDRDEQAFLRTLRRLVAALDDGHGSVSLGMQQRATLPLLWRTFGDALVVTAVNPGVSGVSAGDEVTAIDGKPVMPALLEAETFVSGATPQWRRYIALREISTGTAGKSAALTIRNADGTTRTATLTYAVHSEPIREKRPEKIAELKPGLWYVDLDRATDADFDAALEKLATAKGIVFDLRGYPRKMSAKPLHHLIDSPVESARWNVPLLRRPGMESVEWDKRGRWTLEPKPPRLTKNIAFITDGRAISYAESWMGIIEAYKIGQIVGETTAGTNGNINILNLPGGYRAIFTGMKVLKHDGSRHHGVGIAPTVPAVPTVAGLRAGRDEQLEKAIEVLER